MVDLRGRFGRLLAAHRRRAGLTQEGLAEAAALSVDMISKIEAGSSGARFPSIERLAAAVGVDPAELFTSNLSEGRVRGGAFRDITDKLTELSEADLEWLNRLIDAALARGQEGQPSRKLPKKKGALRHAPSLKRRKS